MKSVRYLSVLVLAMTILTALLAPAVVGVLLRQRLSPALEQLAQLSAGSENLHMEVRALKSGWFFSDYDLMLTGGLWSADGQTLLSQSVRLSVMHGPLIWHLKDTPLAVAEFQLINNEPPRRAREPHLSGSGLLTLDRRLNVRLRAIVGFSALGGEHWLDIRGQQSPARWQILIDADARALASGPAADALRVYQMQGWTHIRAGRAHSRITLADNALDINGNQLPLQSFIRVE